MKDLKWKLRELLHSVLATVFFTLSFYLYVTGDMVGAQFWLTTAIFVEVTKSKGEK